MWGVVQARTAGGEWLSRMGSCPLAVLWKEWNGAMICWWNKWRSMSSFACCSHLSVSASARGLQQAPPASTNVRACSQEAPSPLLLYVVGKMYVLSLITCLSLLWVWVPLLLMEDIPSLGFAPVPTTKQACSSALSIGRPLIHRPLQNFHKISLMTLSICYLLPLPVMIRSVCR